MRHPMSRSGKGSLLVVDETVANLRLLTDLLTAQGYIVHPATDGELALEFIQSTHDVVVGVQRFSTTVDVWVLVSADPVLDEKGEITQVIVSFVDITPSKEAQADLKRMNRHLRAISTSNQVLMQAVKEQDLLDDICRRAR